MSAGVNVISVVPEKWNVRNSMLDDTLAAVRAKYGITPGTHTVLRFDPAKPEEVWSVAQGLLR
jgi:hypothetical protein